MGIQDKRVEVFDSILTWRTQHIHLAELQCRQKALDTYTSIQLK